VRVEGRLPPERAGEPVNGDQNGRRLGEVGEAPGVHAEDDAVGRHDRRVAREHRRGRVVGTRAGVGVDSNERADRDGPHGLPCAGVDLVEHAAPVRHEQLVAHDGGGRRDVPGRLVAPLERELLRGGGRDAAEARGRASVAHVLAEHRPVRGGPRTVEGREAEGLRRRGVLLSGRLRRRSAPGDEKCESARAKETGSERRSHQGDLQRRCLTLVGGARGKP